MVAQREHRLPTAFFFRKGEEARETPGPGESSFKGEHWHVRDVGRRRIRSYLQRITNLFAHHTQQPHVFCDITFRLSFCPTRRHALLAVTRFRLCNYIADRFAWLHGNAFVNQLLSSQRCALSYSVILWRTAERLRDEQFDQSDCRRRNRRRFGFRQRLARPIESRARRRMRRVR